MRIDRMATGVPAAMGRRRTGHGFCLPDGMAPTDSGTAGVQAADAASVLAIQQASGRAAGQAGSARPPGHRLDAVLDDLALLQRALLGEVMDPAILEQMAIQAEALSGEEPGLEDVAVAIGLRIRVELARRQKMSGAGTTKE